MSWLVQYRAGNGQRLTTWHESRREALDTLADSLFSSCLLLWELGGEANEEYGDMLMRHAVRLTAEAEMPGDEGYLLRLSEGRKWVVCPV